MNRINVEAAWFQDARREFLIAKLGSRDAADGAALRLWVLGQRYWRVDQQLIPGEVWQLVEGRDAFESAKLVEVRESGVYVRGAKAHFDWLFARIEAGRKGGLAGANRERDAKGHYLSGAKTAPSKHQAAAKQTPSKRKQTQASSSSSSSSSSSKVLKSAVTMSRAREDRNPRQAAEFETFGETVSEVLKVHGFEPDLFRKELPSAFDYFHTARVFEDWLIGLCEGPAVKSLPLERKLRYVRKALLNEVKG